MPANPKRLSVIGALALIQITAFAGEVRAWEDDVHYGLTKWLAIKAGFTPTAAEEIAKADQKIDRSWFTGPMHITIASACIGSDDRGSGIVHDNHFASQVPPEAPPKARIVVPNKVYLRGNFTVIPTPAGLANLKNLGADLHVFQDTWSHQGEPEIPYLCKPMLGWGHARERGGWSCHLADLTYWWAGRDVLPMAEQTYNVLRQASGNQSAPPWTAIESDVVEFAGLRTKWDKDKWFADRGFADRSFIEFLSLPDCNGPNCLPYRYRAIFDLWQETAANHQPIVEVPPRIAEFFNRFLNLVSRLPATSTANLSEYVDLVGGVRAIRETLNLETPCPKLNDLLGTWMLGQAFVEGRGGETPTALCEAAQKLREAGGQQLSCNEAVDIVARLLGTAPPRAPVPNEPIPYAYVAFPGAQAETYVAFARFRHMPNEVLVMNANAQPRITGFAWIPMR